MTQTLISSFKLLSTSLISDNLERMQGANNLRPFHSGGVMVGTAFTVKTRAGDNLFIHNAFDHLKEGDVLVIDGGGDTSRALIGEIMSTIAKSKGAAGIVIDGAIRDAGALKLSPFPVFAICANHKGPYKEGPGELNVPVSIGGMIVNPGDIVVGDDDGVVAFPRLGAEELLIKTQAKDKKEQETIKSILNGTYKGAYSKG